MVKLNSRRGEARWPGWVESLAGSLAGCCCCWSSLQAHSGGTRRHDFNHRGANKLVAILEDSTGGRVEINNLHFSLRHLALEVDGLVIHGLEGPGEAPYLAIDKLQVRVKLVNFFSHATGAGAASHVGLSLLRAEHPQFHLVIDKNGSTNQPVPKHPSTSTEPLQDTLLDLKAADAELINGVALLNDKAIPFNAAARDLNLNVRYISSTDRYGITLDLNDLPRG